MAPTEFLPDGFESLPCFCAFKAVQGTHNYHFKQSSTKIYGRHKKLSNQHILPHQILTK